ncbi:MAG: tRNA (adenosine(37)-N6)-threonylcarbamoyltransferase complex dimerization subunit type 1 TsaB [Candidatus Binatia bacterium]
MRVLGIDTATRIASVGLIVDGALAGERMAPMAGSHARTVLPLIDDVLAGAGHSLASLDLLAVSLGPGSFTGLRIGLSVAKGLALAAPLPLVGVPTLEAYAIAVGPRPGTVWPVLDARKGEVYTAAFRWRGDTVETVLPAMAIAPQYLAARLSAPGTLVGDGVEAYPDVWAAAAGGSLERVSLTSSPPSGVVVARLGARRFTAGGPDDLDVLEPRYCRASEAELGAGSRAVSTE